MTLESRCGTCCQSADEVDSESVFHQRKRECAYGQGGDRYISHHTYFCFLETIFSDFFIHAMKDFMVFC